MAVLTRQYRVKLLQGESKGQEHLYLHGQVTTIPNVASMFQGDETPINQESSEPAEDKQEDKTSNARKAEGLKTIMKDMDALFDDRANSGGRARIGILQTG